VTYGADIKETTKFAAGSYALPFPVLGGRLRIGILYGETTLKAEAKPNDQVTLPVKGAIGSAEVNNTFYGGSLVWSGDIGYLSAAGIMTSGDTEMIDKFICCVGTIYREKHDGYSGSLVAGRVFPLVADGLKLDLRGGLGYTKTKGDPFDTLAPGPVKIFDAFNYSSASASFSPMLFVDMNFNGVLLRPYVQATYKQLFRYTNFSQFTGVGVMDPGSNYTEDKRFYSVEGGLNARYGNFILGAALYHEHSANSSTAGTKVGVTYQF
jgi:hypothetical protein